jgi:predicted Zn-dependent protease
MKLKILRDGLIVCIVFIGAWFLFARIAPEKSFDGNVFSDEQVEKISDWLAKEIEKQFKVIHDHPWEASIDEMRIRLEDALPDYESGIQIQVLDQSQANAFATLGGRIYIFKGLLELCDKPDELYAVLAHEMGHIYLKHVEKKLLTEFSLAILLAGVSGGDLALAGEIIRTMSSGAFSRTNERQADDFALDLLYKTGIDPANMGIIFRKLKEQSPTSQYNFEMLSTHPDIRKRIKHALEFDKSGIELKPFEVPWPDNDQ